ncbi:MAG: tRNA-specific adenosine deaminase subunit tad3 [Geoglossum umbratile]|nr:MAG: tRNA-specific adenosine deaminase subunit tad3 [Geoglossum umbratile]
MGTLAHQEEHVCLSPEVVKQDGLVRLKTKLEVKTDENVVRVWVVDIPAKCASGLLDHLRQSFPDLDKINLQHLRRFVKPEFLPGHLKEPVPFNITNPNVYSERDSSNSLRSPGTLARPSQGCNSSSSSHAILSMLVSPTRIISEDVLADNLKAFGPLLDYLDGPPIVWTTTVPLLPPNTAEQAEYWSQRYWPTVYKGSNPFGPHPSILSRAEQDLRSKVGHFMSLASQAGTQAKTYGLGDEVGAVIADGSAPDSGSLMIVAGDARWRCPVAESVGCEGRGNVMGHAVMRAIGMVARRRLHSVEGANPEGTPFGDGKVTQPIVSEKMDTTTDAFLEQPLTPIENTFYHQGAIPGDGYLCVGLDIYTTHEPCVMCSMAVLHSRFRGIVFGRRMVRTGGLTAELAPPPCTHSPNSESCGLGYGMFWRGELNWKLPAWQLEDQGRSSIPDVDQNIHA